MSYRTPTERPRRLWYVATSVTWRGSGTTVHSLLSTHWIMARETDEAEEMALKAAKKSIEKEHGKLPGDEKHSIMLICGDDFAEQEKKNEIR